MDAAAIGLRCQDFHDSLRNTVATPAKEVSFEQTLLIGKAASLAMHLRGLPLVANMTQLKYAASQLGIGSLELDAVLRELEVIDFVLVSKSSTGERQVVVRVPVFSSGYSILGERWKDSRPSEVEQAAVGALETLHNGP